MRRVDKKQQQQQQNDSMLFAVVAGVVVDNVYFYCGASLSFFVLFRISIFCWLIVASPLLLLLCPIQYRNLFPADSHLPFPFWFVVLYQSSRFVFASPLSSVFVLLVVIVLFSPSSPILF
jgi:hypothetical protein